MITCEYCRSEFLAVKKMKCENCGAPLRTKNKTQKVKVLPSLRSTSGGVPYTHPQMGMQGMGWYPGRMGGKGRW